ncbi:hypothetical protein FRC10_008040, partial [Ceratobasidium sp. 414]
MNDMKDTNPDAKTDVTDIGAEWDKEAPGNSEEDLQFEKRLIRKLDLRVCPCEFKRILESCVERILHSDTAFFVGVMLVYLVSFLGEHKYLLRDSSHDVPPTRRDKTESTSGINARLYGLEADLGMKGSQYQTAVSVLFVTYLLFEVPSNLVLKKLRPSRYIAFITFTWGIVATLSGTVQSYGGLIACRLILGLFEAGLFPGMAVYLTFWYTRKELALRIGYLFVSAAFAGAFGGLLATAIGRMDGVAGQRGWRWILIIEGLPSVILGCVIPFVLADDPDSAGWLTEKEKAYIRARKLRQPGETADAQKFHWSDVRKCFKDPKVYAFAAAQFGCDTMLY